MAGENGNNAVGESNFVPSDPIPLLVQMITETVEAGIKGTFSKEMLQKKCGGDKLDSILRPTISPTLTTDGKETTGVLLSLLCEITAEDYPRIISKINQAASDAALHGIIYDMNISNSISVSQTGNYARFSHGGIGSGKSRGLLYNIIFSRNQDKDVSGNLSIYISKAFAAKNLYFATSIFDDIWEDIILDEDRLAIYGDEDKDILDLDLTLYKGKLKLDDVAGYEDVKRMIRRDVFYPFMHRNALNKIVETTVANGYEPSEEAVLFYGEPGTGKTLIARAISSEQDMTFFYLNLSNLYSKWYGESAQKLKDNLDYVEAYSKKHGKTVLYMDEIDSIGKRGGESGTEKEDSRVINTLLVKLDGVAASKENENLLIICATNKYDPKNKTEDALDSALVSRLSNKIYIGKPSKEDRAKIWSKHAQHLQRADLETLAVNTNNMVGRDIKMIAGVARREFGVDKLTGKTSAEVPTVDYYMNAIKEFSRDTTVKKQNVSAVDNLYG